VTKPNPKTVHLQELLISVCIWLCTIIVLHTSAQNSSDNLPSYPPDNHHNSDVV